MAQLIVRRVEPAVVARLRRRAAAHGRSMEAEHREILRTTLLGRSAGSLKAQLLAIPAVGRDTDFARTQDRGRRVTL